MPTSLRYTEAPGKAFFSERLSQFTTPDDVRAALARCLHPERISAYEQPPVYMLKVVIPGGALLHDEQGQLKDGIVDLSTKTQAFYDAAADRGDHLSKLEHVFNECFVCKICLLEEEEGAVVQQAWSILKRMPAFTPPLPEPLDDVPDEYFRGNTKLWEQLRVSSFVHDSLIRVIFEYVIRELYYASFANRGDSLHDPSYVGHLNFPHVGTRRFQQNLDEIGRLIGLISNICTQASSKIEQTNWFIVRAYLWNFWQPAKVFHNYCRVATDVAGTGMLTYDGYMDVAHTRFSPAPGISLRQLSQMSSEKWKTGNLCSWILQLLTSQPLCWGLDFRLFYRSYAEVLGDEAGRCRQGSESDLSCDGTHPQHCLRFHGAKIEEQSAHDHLCEYIRSPESEPKLVWDQVSYRRAQGARAVAINASLSIRKLPYCTATSDTMAISHVWSHGQGGRPENGINECLHRKYCRLAVELGCNSYWWDSACIPEDHELRSEAINHINGVFSSSKAVLVCDKDIMQIDATNLSITIKESLLVAIILSDWNTRAWTMLESMKGRSHLYLLCKDDRTVNFKSMVQDVVARGHIDIAVFAWQVLHMLPQEDFVVADYQSDDDYDELSGQRLTTIGSWLSHRPASRLGDEFVIWSLLVHSEAEPHADAVAFWKAQVAHDVSLPTGFLMSSTKRIHVNEQPVDGLSWAPESPFVVPRNTLGITSAASFRASEALDTRAGVLRQEGLWASWRQYALPAETEACHQNGDPAEQELRKIRATFLKPHEHGIVLQPKERLHSPSIQLEHDDQGYSANGTLVAICASDKKRQKTLRLSRSSVYTSYEWIWRGVYEWPYSTPFPKSERFSDNDDDPLVGMMLIA